jgi:hypothetical protein
MAPELIMRIRALLYPFICWVPIAAVALTAVGARPLNAQGDQVRNGFWLMGGVAAASNRTDCTNCPEEVRINGFGTVLRAGGKASRYVMIGGELYGFLETDDDSRTEVGGVLFIAQWYPWTKLGFWFRAGGGISYANVEINTATSPEQITKAGLGLSLGFGWDLRVARMVSITPFLTSYYNGLGAIDFSGGTLDNVLTTMWQAGVGVTFH